MLSATPRPIRNQGRDGRLLFAARASRVTANAPSEHLLHVRRFNVRSNSVSSRPLALFDDRPRRISCVFEKTPATNAGLGHLGVARFKAAGPVEEPLTFSSDFVPTFVRFCSCWSLHPRSWPWSSGPVCRGSVRARALRPYLGILQSSIS